MENFKSLRFLFSCLVLSIVSCGASDKYEPKLQITTNNSFHGTWITSAASQVLSSRDSIRAAINVCDDCGINNIFVVVWNQGRTFYPSALMKNTFGVEIANQYAGRDPLKEMIEEAHKKNIKVHAWFEYGFSTSYSQKGGLILQTKPSWAAKDQDGNLVVKNGFDWMNAFLPDVQQFMIDLVSEVVRNYDVDGVQGDDRMPALPSTAGYDDYTVNLYKLQHNGTAPPSNYKDVDWLNWRTALLTEFMGRLYSTVKGIKSLVIVSSAPSIYPWGRDEYLQDWPSWLKKGYVDLVIPQIYRYDISSYQSTLAQQVSYLNTITKTKFYPGLLLQNGIYNPTDEFLMSIIQSNRGSGFSGESFWFFEGLKKYPAFFTLYKQGKL